MFTVMICGKEFYKSVKENHSHILDLLLHDKQCALLTWNPYADTLEEAVPGLDELTAGHVEWRAVVVGDADTFGFDYIDRQNPFDVVDSVKAFINFDEELIFNLLDEYNNVKADMAKNPDSEDFAKLSTKEAELREQISALIEQSKLKIEEFRRRKKENYLKACSNPLTRLSIWMLGSPMQNEPTADVLWPKELLAEEYPVDWNYFKNFKENRIFPAEIETFKSYLEKYKALTTGFLGGSLLQKKPSEVLIISERLLKHADDNFDQVRESHEELEYDNFCDDNLYPTGLRYVLYDVEYDNKHRCLESHLGFVSLVYMMSVNQVPDECMRAQRVYNAKIKINEQKSRDFFTRYLRKLEATKKLLLRKRRQYDSATEEDELSSEEAIKLFETDVNIPVEAHLTTERDELLAKYNIGLSRNCPVEEEKNWLTQVNEITKKFIRYLREPRRALKSAVKKDFKKQSIIEDERIFKLGENSLEDIEFRVQEKEQQMVETVTNHLYKTKEYTDQIEDADQMVRGQIAKRMTLQKTLCVALIVLFAYLLGFIPLFVSNMKDSKTFMTTIAITGIALGMMVLVGLVFLLIVRAKHKKYFDKFNNTMINILNEIEIGLTQFSKYLGKMCDVMRGISVFNYLKKPTDLTPKILQKHLYDIQTRIDGVNGLFVSVMQVDQKNEETPYNYDFTKLVDYPYEVPYDEIESFVEFILSNNYVSVPINYVEQVTLIREDLYD